MLHQRPPQLTTNVSMSTPTSTSTINKNEKKKTPSTSSGTNKSTGTPTIEPDAPRSHKTRKSAVSPTTIQTPAKKSKVLMARTLTLMGIMKHG
jgi:hypothetical protein